VSQVRILLQHIAREYAWHPGLRQPNAPQVFFVSQEFSEAAAKLTSDVLGIEREGDKVTSVRIADCARLAAPIQVIVIEDEVGQIAIGAIQNPDNEDVFIVTGWDGQLRPVMVYRAGTNHVQTIRRPGEGAEHDAFSALGFDTITLIALINTPNHVTAEEGGARQTRRQLEREFGAKSRVVRWKVKGDRTRTSGSASAESGIALHYRRGHYRRARPWFKNVEELRRPGDDTPQLYQWIEGTWCGSPEFGVVSHSYTPRLGPALGAS
jgi:hypothetical protein